MIGTYRANGTYGANDVCACRAGSGDCPVPRLSLDEPPKLHQNSSGATRSALPQISQSPSRGNVTARGVDGVPQDAIAIREPYHGDSTEWSGSFNSSRPEIVRRAARGTLGGQSPLKPL
jgi:hypothetical protein